MGPSPVHQGLVPADVSSGAVLLARRERRVPLLGRCDLQAPGEEGGSRGASRPRKAFCTSAWRGGEERMQERRLLRRRRRRAWWKGSSS